MVAYWRPRGVVWVERIGESEIVLFVVCDMLFVSRDLVLSEWVVVLCAMSWVLEGL